ncbi:MAG: hypothetical protein ACYC97_02040 [Metallibacterium sp.]
MATNKDILTGIAIGAGATLLGVYLIHIFQKEQELNIANQAINSGMFNNILSNPSGSSNSGNGNINGGLS